MKRAAWSLFVIFFLFFLPKFSVTRAQSPLINEIMVDSSSSSFGDWVELYNPTSSLIDLTGWSIYDLTSNGTPSLTKTLSGNLVPGGFITFDLSNRLNNSGDTITLKDPQGSLADTRSYSSDPGVDISLGLYPDGSSDWQSLNPTKGTANTALSQTNPPSPTPSPSTQPSSTPTASDTGGASSTFTIDHIPDQIGSEDSFTVNVKLDLPNNPNTSFFLKGAFAKAGSTNYFGLVMVNNTWVKNSSSANTQLPIQTDSSGSWQGSLQAMPDTTDSGFTGTDLYNFKAGRYDSNGNNLTWSNILTTQITFVALPSNSPIPSASSSPAPNRYSSSPGSSSNDASTSAQTLGESLNASTSGQSSFSNPSAPKSLPGKPVNWLVVLGIIILIAGLSIFTIPTLFPSFKLPFSLVKTPLFWKNIIESIKLRFYNQKI